MGQLCSAPAEAPAQQKHQHQHQPQHQPNNTDNSKPSQSSGGAPVANNSVRGPTYGGPREWPASSSAGDAKRFEASQHAQKRGELLSQSQEAFKRGEKALAAQLSAEGKKEGAEMERCNREAADLYFNDNNKKHDEGTIDLHGLYVQESIEKLEQRLTQCSKSGRSELIVIVGRGNHSKDGVRKIKPAIEKLMAQYKLRVAVDSPNAGCITVFFNDSASGIEQPPGKQQDSASQCLHQ